MIFSIHTKITFSYHVVKMSDLIIFAKRSRAILLWYLLDIKERIKIPHTIVFFNLFKNMVNFDPFLQQPNKFLRKPKSRDKKKIVSNSRRQAKKAWFCPCFCHYVEGSQASFAWNLEQALQPYTYILVPHSN